RRTEGTVLVVVTSLHDVSRGQVDALCAALPPDDVLVLNPTLVDLLEGGSLDGWLAAATKGGLPPVVLLLSPTERAGEGEHARRVATGLADLSGAVIAQGVGAVALMG